MTRQLLLAGGTFALLDDEDYEAALAHPWCERKDEHTSYAQYSTPRVAGKQRTVLLHRWVAVRKYGSAVDATTVDHVDGNGLDCRRHNLRPATLGQQQHNTGLRSTNASGYKGVSWSKSHRKWQACITVGSKQRHLGYYNEPEYAAQVVESARTELHKEFGRSTWTKEK